MAASVAGTVFPFTVFAGDDETDVMSETDVYTCDFTQLVKDGADTYYGTAEDIIELDEYTTAYLTYEGTYVDADGKVYIKDDSPCNGDGKYENGSYISFTAPSDGSVTVSGADISLFYGSTYSGSYGSNLTFDAEGGSTYVFAYRKGSTYIDTLTFTPSAEEPEPEPEPPSGDDAYVSPSTTWDFETEPSGGENAPALGGNAQWSDGEIVFPADTRDSGTMSLSFAEPVRNNVSVEMDIIGHDRTLGNQYITFSVSNSEETVAELHVHPYSDNGDEYSARGLTVCGTQTASGDDVRAAWTGTGTTHVKADIDYYARKLTVTVGDTPFEADIPEGTVTDVTNIAITVSRSGSTVASRYISADNLTVSEFESAGEQAPSTVAEGYSEETIAGYPCRVKVQDGAPAVIYLSSELRYGSDNVSQLYDAKYIFDKLGERATLAAPQTEDGFTDVSQLVSEVRDMYNAPSVTVIGQSESTDAALSSGADRIVTIAGSGSAIPSGDVWAFAGCNDETTPVADVKTMVNSLQLAGVNTRYTEYPFGGHKLAETAANEEGLDEWIINGAEDSRVVDLVLFSGQSNMAGRGDYDEATVCAAGEGYEYHAVTEPGVLSSVTEPFGKYENNDAINDNSGQGVDRRSGDMVSSVMSAYYDKTGVPMVGVQASRGGQDTTYFINNMGEMQSRFNEAADYLENAGYTIRKKLLVWCQGEADADKGRSDETYKSNTLSIFEDLRDGCGIEDMFIVRTGHYNIYYGGETPSEDDLAKDAEYLRISNAQQALADENDNIYIAASLYSDEYLSEMRDQYHYYQSVYNSVGKTAGEAIAEVYENEPVPTPEPIAGVYELTSSEGSIDVSGLKNYGTDTYRVYSSDGSYETAKAEDGKVANETGGEVVVVPEYRFEFTNQQDPADENIAGYVKAGEGSYSKATGFGLASENYRINENGCKADENPIKVDVPEGFYDITVYRKGGCRADIYSGGTLIANNTTSSGAQNRGGSSALMEIPAVHHGGGSLDITFGNTSGNNERIASLKIARVPEKYRKPVIWVAGDSESSNYYPFDADGDDLERDKIMITGFGQQLSKLLSDKYSVSNYGQPSATVKTWYDECFESVNKLMQPGDTILVDFGINDAVSSSNKMSIDEMKSQMELIFNAAKAKGVTPILISPVYNGKYQHRTYFTYDAAADTNGMYEFAEKNGVACIDLNKYTQLYVNKAVEDTGDADWRTNNYHVGDNLHLTQHSAVLAASFIAAGMKVLGYETSDNEFVYSDISSVSEGNIRGEETGIKRVYSAAAAEAFMRDGTVTVPGGDTPATTAPATDAPVAYPAEMTYDGTEVRMTAKDNSVKSAVLAAAEYDGGALKSLKVYDVNFGNGEAKQEAAVPEGTVFYLWNSLSGMQPMAESLEYTGAAEETAAPTKPPETTAPATEIPATAVPEGRLIYSDDFEDHNDGETAGWESYAGTAAIKTDSTSGIGKYMTVVSGKSGTCRSGLTVLPQTVTDNFVFECDLKTGDGNNVSELQLVESKSSVYQNHGVYSNAEYALTLDRPRGSRLYVVNNGKSDSGLTLESYNSPAVTTAEIPDNAWLHIKAVGNFDTKTIIVDVTSLDGNTVYYRGMTDMSAGMDSWQCIHLLSPSTGVDTCIDNIKITEATEYDLSPVFHDVTVKCKSYSFDQYVEDGSSVINIPDVSVYGEFFEGWQVNGGAVYSTEELSELPVTADSVIEGIVNEGYIESLSGVNFVSYPAGNELAMGADENTYGDNIISLSITGEQGTSLVTEPDPRVTDYKIEWSFDGFRLLDGRPTGEEGSSYCDSYGLCEVSETAQTSVNFRLKRTAANYYGRVTAKVTYNGKTMEVSRPLVLLGDKTSDSGRLLPAAGYESDYNKYDSALSGYTFEEPNALFGNWAADGSDTKRYVFMTDETGNFIRFTRDASGNSAYGYNEIGSITSQTIFEQDVRFNADGSIRYTGGRPTSESSSAFSLSMSDGALSFNGEKLCSAEHGVWYHAVICADPTTKKAWAKVYEGDDLIGESGTVDFEDSDFSDAVYYRIDPSRVKDGSIDFNNVIIRRAEIADITVDAPETAEIPESGSTCIEISMSAVTTDGYDATGKAEWRVDENADGVSIASSGDRSAVLTVDSSAAAGDLPVSVTIGGKTEQFNIKLTGTKDNIAFVKAPAGVMIPSEGTAEYEFSAAVRNGAGEDIGGEVEYSLGGSYEGISLNGGMLEVSSEAKPCEIVITASCGELSRSRKVSVYDLKFDFTADPKDGYTAVNSAVYSDQRGYGIDNAVSDTEYTFKVKLERGKVYSVKAEYSGTIKCERIEGFSDGFERTRDSLGEDSCNVAVFGDDIMDITVDGTLERIEITPAAKTAADVPDWWTIGDSTIQQNGSWAYTIASDETSDLSRYPELDAVIDVFHNSGRAGRQHMSYYNEGLLNNVLCGIEPGDVVSISGMGVNDSSSSQEDFKRYTEIYMNAVIDMGGYVILGSYTPSGNYGATEGKVYDADTMTFRGMRTDAYDRAIREVYEENKDNEKVLGFLDIGAMADEKMTADVHAVYEANLASGEAAARAAANARAEEMMGWWKDYNHYYTEFSNYILPDITKAAAEMIASR